MKVILIKDVKGKGKLGDIIELPNGHANFLIRNKSARPATEDAVDELKQEREAKEAAELALIDEMKLKKEFIENNPIAIKVKTGEKQRVFGTVSTKQVVSEYMKKYDVKIDKKKIKSSETINALGTYILEIELHKKVIAKLDVKVEG
jgi:large subunit ribosomal protein L9